MEQFFTAVGDKIDERDYKPLLMLLGSGKVSLESTQVAVDNSVFITTNLEEMDLLENQLTSSKLLDRVERIPVNYLLDYNAEMKILSRDIDVLKETYDIDPNLVEIASIFAVLTRLLPPTELPEPLEKKWSSEKVKFYYGIAPEQKLYLYALSSADPVKAIDELPFFHPFRNEAIRLGVDLEDVTQIKSLFDKDNSFKKLQDTGIFTADEVKMIDDEFLSTIRMEHYPHEGKHGISVRQLQNIMRSAVSNSDGTAVWTDHFIDEVEKCQVEGATYHTWLNTPDIVESILDKREKLADEKKLFTPVIRKRSIGKLQFKEGESDYCDPVDLSMVAEVIWFENIIKHITISTVDRDPKRIEVDLRKYIQMCLLFKASTNKAFGRKMMQQFSFLDPDNGNKIDKHDNDYMYSIEKILYPKEILFDSNDRPSDNEIEKIKKIRVEIADKYLDLIREKDVVIQDGKNIIHSRDDMLLDHFKSDYDSLLSNKRTDGKVDPAELEKSFYLLKNKPSEFLKEPKLIQDMANKIIENMNTRFDYSERIALDTVLFAVDKGLFSFDTTIY